MIDLKGIEQTNLVPVEISYLGSFIKDVKNVANARNADFHTQRLVVFKETDFTDEFSKVVAKNINLIYGKNEVPTVKSLTEFMVRDTELGEKSAGVESEIDKWNKTMALVQYYADRGANTIQEFRTRERILDDGRRARLLSDENISRKMSEINREYANPIDRAYALKAYVDEIVGSHEFSIKTTDTDAQLKLLDELPGQYRDMLNKPRFTFPSHWGVNSMVPVLRPGEMCVLSGGTGDGKSALSMQFAEWSCIVGKNVLVIHMEDSDQTILMRQTLRWIGGSLLELERGDPDGLMDQMIDLRKKWATRGGSITYKYLAGNTINLIIDQIKETAAMLESQGKKLEVIVLDYFQKIDFDTSIKAGQNYVNSATMGAEALKIIAERLGAFMFVVSQETPDQNGGKHAAWSRALEQKPQIYISLERAEIKKAEDEERVKEIDPTTGVGLNYPLAKIGDRSVWMKMQFKKVNNGRQGIKWLFFDGPRFRAFDPEFMKALEDGREEEFSVPVLTPVDTELRKRLDKQEQVYRRAYRELLNPEEKRKQKMEQHES